MQIIIKCGGEGCGREFKGETEERNWLCPYCDHEIENKNYPFLCARLMEAKRVPDETDWRDLYDFLLEKARMKMLENNLLLVENGLEKTSFSRLIEFEEKLDEEGLDFKELTLKALKVLGEQCKVQEEQVENAIQ
jgi:DNA-directed RNA polymerase subunit RPC12/RpoP